VRSGIYLIFVTLIVFVILANFFVDKFIFCGFCLLSLCSCVFGDGNCVLGAAAAAPKLVRRCSARRWGG
jgi:hypothetical protein